MIDRILEEQNCNTTNSAEKNSIEIHPSVLVTNEDIKCENVFDTSNLDETINTSNEPKFTPVLSDTGNIIAAVSDEKYNVDLIFDEIDEEILFKNQEFEYRYSDCEDSASEEGSDDDVNSGPNSGDSVTEVCNTISTQLEHVFAQWAIQCAIPKAIQKKFLRRIRNDISFLKLPLDQRTIVKAPRHGEIHQIKGGEYCHFGLKSVLEKIVRSRLSVSITNNNIDLLINIDGAPLGNDAVINLWPILT